MFVCLNLYVEKHTYVIECACVSICSVIMKRSQTHSLPNISILMLDHWNINFDKRLEQIIFQHHFVYIFACAHKYARGAEKFFLRIRRYFKVNTVYTFGHILGRDRNGIFSTLPCILCMYTCTHIWGWIKQKNCFKSSPSHYLVCYSHQEIPETWIEHNVYQEPLISEELICGDTDM